MKNLDSKLAGLTPRNKKKAHPMPLDAWIEEMNTDGVIVIPAFVSKKNPKIPKSWKTNDLRKQFYNCDGNITGAQQKSLEKLFKHSFYALADKEKDVTYFIAFTPDNVEEMEKKGYVATPMKDPLKKNPTKEEIARRNKESQDSEDVAEEPITSVASDAGIEEPKEEPVKPKKSRSKPKSNK